MEQVLILNKNDVKSNRANNSKLHFLAVLILLELVLGGAGRVIVFGPITVRYILFLVAILYFVIRVFQNNLKLEKNIFILPVVVYFFFYVISIMNGINRGYPLSDIALSSQGYLYLLMFFPFTLFINTTIKAEVAFSIFNKFSILIALLSIGIFIAFALDPTFYDSINPVLLNLEYGHLSVRYGLPSVFFKTSPYMALAFIHELNIFVNIPDKRNFSAITRMMILLVASLITLTMGIWISLVIGVLLVIFFSKGSQRVGAIVLTSIFGVFLLSVFFDFIISALINRFSRTDSSYIIKSDQLLTMLNVWSENLFFGKGFGVRLTFVTDVATRVMVKFELFWLELLVNMGLVGFVSYVYIIAKNFFFGLKSCQKLDLREETLVKSLIIGLIVLSVITSVNPFLNNPIGLGYLVIVMTSINAFYQKSVLY